jgi:tetratricopeptide (TPR) repeat protein
VRPLSPSVAAEIESLCAEARGAAASGAFDSALARWEAALELLPPPHAQWGAALRIWAAMADARFHAGDFAGALETIALALEAGADDPRLHLRRGQCLDGMGHRDAGLDALLRAHVGGGDAVFAGEEPRWLHAVRAVLPPRPGEDDAG